MVSKTFAQIDTSLLVLDPDNPRLRHIHGAKASDQERLENLIKSQGGFSVFAKNIAKNGVRDPIYVSKLSDGRYMVEEGNRRTTALRMLLERQINEGKNPPEGISYDLVDAWVFDEKASRKEIQLAKVSLQTGKKAWIPANIAAIIYDLHYNIDFAMSIEDIAEEMSITKGIVQKNLDAYLQWKDYVEKTEDVNPERFSYFFGLPVTVKQWNEASPENKKDFYKWINPAGGVAKIRSVASRGGLRDFGKVVQDSDAIEMLREDPRTTIEQALDISKRNDIMKELPFLNRILIMAKNMDDLDDDQRFKITQDLRIMRHIESLKNACDVLWNDLQNISESNI